LLEIDEAVVSDADLALVRAGDEGAKERIKAQLHGKVLYLHAMPVDEGETVVTLRELKALYLVRSVTLNCTD
jgi:hypothetical protein